MSRPPSTSQAIQYVASPFNSGHLPNDEVDEDDKDEAVVEQQLLYVTVNTSAFVL